MMKLISIIFFSSLLCYLAEAQLTQAQINNIMSIHNQYRSAVCVPNIQWNASVAVIAQNYGNQCIKGHSQIAGYGENLAWGTGFQPGPLTQLWADEISKYNCVTGQHTGVVGHYTQMTWSRSTQIGCGFTTCSFGNYLVCNYYPPGNYVGQLAYTCPTQCPSSSTTSQAASLTTSKITTSRITTSKITTSRITTSRITTSPITSSQRSVTSSVSSPNPASTTVAITPAPVVVGNDSLTTAFDNEDLKIAVSDGQKSTREIIRNLAIVYSLVLIVMLYLFNCL